MPAFKVLLTDHPWSGTEIEDRILSPIDAQLVDAPDGSEPTLAQLAADVDAIATCWAPVTETVIRAANKCRLVCRCGIGLDNISVNTATELGIPVTNVPDYCVDEVADHTMALILALARKVAFYDLRMKRGEYNQFAGPKLHRLQGRTLGLIGFGRIARAVFARAQGFGLNVIANSSSGNDYGTGCRMLSFEELLADSDIVSVHAPLTPQTRHLLGREAFANAKPELIVVNTSRGPLIDPEALFTALQSGRVSGAGLDVFEPEPPDLSSPLYQHENVIITPHAAFVSEESVIELRERVCRQIVDFLSGRVPENVVNPEVLV